MEKKTKDIDRKNKEKGKSQVSSVWGGRFTGVPSDIMEKINPNYKKKRSLPIFFDI